MENNLNDNGDRCVKFLESSDKIPGLSVLWLKHLFAENDYSTRWLDHCDKRNVLVFLEDIKSFVPFRYQNPRQTRNFP